MGETSRGRNVQAGGETSWGETARGQNVHKSYVYASFNTE